MKPAYLERPSRILLGYLGVALIFAWELLAPGRSLFRWDTLVYNWPVLLEARSQILSGHWPFWASSFCAGNPLLANANAGVLYPMRLLCWLLPLKFGYHLFLFAHVWLAFVGMHIFLRRGLRLPWVAAVFGALVYGGCGYARSMWDTHNFMALPWIPLGLAALLESRRRMRLLIPAAMTAGCWSMLILCGDFQAACLWFPAALFLALLLPERRVLLRVLGLGAALAALLTAMQWVPAFYATQESYRAGGIAFEDAVERSFNPVRAVEFFLPHAFGNRDAWYGAGLAGPGATRVWPWVSSAHVGLLTWLGIYLALRRMKRPVIVWGLVLATVSLLLSYGKFLPGFRLWLELPVIGGFRYPEKYLLWTSLALATLAAHGAATLGVLLRRASMAHARQILFARWSIVMLMGAIIAAVAVWSMAEYSSGLVTWLRGAYVNALLSILLALVVALKTWPAFQHAALIGVVLVDLALPWYAEKPTTNLFDPQAPTSVSQVIASSDSPRGRFLRDRAVSRIPLPPAFKIAPSSARRSMLHRESMDYNVPRLWGQRTADGFSPLERKAMREFREAYVAPHGERVSPSAVKLAHFCRQSAVEWLLTTPGRLRDLRGQGLNAVSYATWGDNDEVVLARVRGVQEATLQDPVSGTSPRAAQVWRQRPGAMRIDMDAGAARRLVVSETYDPGWRATDEQGHALAVFPIQDMWIGLNVPEGATQVRLAYTPAGWGTGVAATLAGLVCLAAALFHAFRPRMPRVVRHRAVAVAAACVVFVVIGGTARNEWSCMFDEGFHVARGMALAAKQDSRLSYFHPPLQNLVCGYFANLAWGEQVVWPETRAWESADVTLYSVEFATANAAIFPDLVRAARTGTLLFGMLLCAVGVIWAARMGGPVAAWLAACGLATSPTLLVHGNISTTDMGVTALVVAGTFFTWRGAREMPWRNLFWAMCCFVFAATAKFTGLIWLATFLLLCVPCLAWQETRPSLLFMVIVGAGFFALCLLALYGTEPQVVRAPGLSWSGAKVIAGRYMEGLVQQTEHAMEGHRAYFDGQIFDAASPWHMPASVVLKMPAFWLIAAVAGTLCFFRRLLRTDVLIPLLPALFFGVLLLSANRLAIGVRHALPIVALATIGGAVAAARIPRPKIRAGIAALLAVSSVFSVSMSYPNLLSYFPQWAGGTMNGHRWLLDSNYDWGQELEVLEKNWAELTRANGGRPPSLVSYGFVDPRVIYHMDLGAHSYGGYMEYRAVREGGNEIESQWREKFKSFPGTTVASLSALELQPHDIDFTRVRRGEDTGRMGLTFRVYRSD